MSKSTIITTFVVSSILTTCCFANTPSQTVKITPLGSHAGEFCRYDRAMLFEDPNGTRILYDPGHTVAGPNDPRLGKIDAVILSSVHTDHLGSSRIAAANAGTCKKPNINVKTPNSNTAEIIVNKNAVSHLGGEMAQFMQNKVKAAGGRKLTNIKKLRFGGEATVGGVKIAVVPVTHSNGAEPVFLDKKLKALLGKNGLTAYVGPDNGFILSFTNGLVVYLSGDSGITAEQDVTVRNYYGAKLAIINAGGVYTSGPKEEIGRASCRERV